ncbi:hypothetical protein ACU8KH_00078 [Lachancea thermotolerans]
MHGWNSQKLFHGKVQFFRLAMRSLRAPTAEFWYGGCSSSDQEIPGICNAVKEHCMLD